MRASDVGIWIKDHSEVELGTFMRGRRAFVNRPIAFKAKAFACQRCGAERAFQRPPAQTSTAITSLAQTCFAFRKATFGYEIVSG